MRAELLRRPQSTENPYETVKRSRQDGFLNERDQLQHADSQLDQFLQRGRDVLENLVEQKGLLKRVQGGLLSSANSLGLSRKTIQMVERRTTQDKWIFFGGALFTLVCFWYIYKWFAQNLSGMTLITCGTKKGVRGLCLRKHDNSNMF